MNARDVTIPIAALLVSLGATPCFAADRFLVTARLSHAGTGFGEPRLLIEEGQQASVERRGDGAYSLSVTPVALGDGQVLLTTALRSPYGAIAPIVTTRLDQETTISNGEIEMAFVVSRAGR